MSENKVETLIRPLEAFAEKDPGAYRLRVALLAVLGYAYLIFIVAVLLAVTAVTLYSVRLNWLLIKILWIPLAIVGLVLRSLWITLPEPDGKELTREDAPALFELIEEVRTSLQGPTIHRVLLSEDFNAGIVQIPQFGMFGWLRNYLVVGLPLLRALSPQEFRAVLAHEVGHLSGKHGRFSGWIYRLRQSWETILERVHYERHYASFLFEPFIKWYAPYLNAYSFVLARAQERQADQYAVDLAGKEVAAVTLVRVGAKDRSLTENFWPNFFRKSKDQPKTPPDPFVQMLGVLDQPIGSTNLQKWFLEALRVPTGYDDTHPALSDRLAAIGFEKDGKEVNGLIDALLVADEQKETAATFYLRELPEDFLPWLNRLWRERLAHVWSENHEEIKKARKRLEDLEEQAKTRELTIEERWEQIKLLAGVEDDKATLPLLESLLADKPDHVGAQFAVGAILLEQHDPKGVEHLEKAMQLDAASTGEACVLLSSFYFDQGDKDLAESFRKRASEHFEKEKEQYEQATTFTQNDRYIPHGLEEPAIQELKQNLSKVHGLNEAYLVRKELDGTDAKVYLLAASANPTWHEGRNDKHVELLFNELVALPGLPGPMLFLSLDGVHAFLLPKIAKVEGARLFASANAG